MDAALIAFAACLLTSFGGRAHLTIAMLAASLGRSGGLLFVAMATALLATVTMALAGASLSAQFAGEPRKWIIFGAVLLAAIELAIPVNQPAAKEPTRSFGAIGLALLAKQIADAPRLCVFASAAALARPDPAIAGGGLAALLATLAAWIFADLSVGMKTRYFVRAGFAAILGMIGIFIGSIV